MPNTETPTDLAALEAEIAARYAAGDTEPPVLWEMRARADAMRARMARGPDGREDPDSCECDNTHDANDTVCRWCWARGRRLPSDAELPDDAKPARQAVRS